MLSDHKEIWIKTGYETFALLGQNGLKIEPLAKKVGISKSSFYHHFADIDIFLEYLLEYHIHQSYIIANKEKLAQNIDPELINVLIEHKTDLLFNRQLRVLRVHKQFNDILLKSNQITGDYFVMVGVKDIRHYIELES
jgi:AcrR family transcriptional regulator